MANGDSRVALQTLRASAKNAERERRTVTLDDLKEAFKSARNSKSRYFKSKLNEHQKILLEIVTKSKYITSANLYLEYRRFCSHPLTERGYRLQMEFLVRLGIIRAIGERRWRSFGIS